MLRDVYGNTSATGFTLSYFLTAGHAAEIALLASPFFTTYEPIKTLSDGGCQISLLVRLCEITSPQALGQALNDPNVKVRYYTDEKFHAKLYIIDDTALVGSANLTKSGLEANREVSVLLQRGRDAGFDILPSLFDGLWEQADTLNSAVLDRFAQAQKSFANGRSEEAFNRHLADFVEAAEPTNVRVGSEKVSHRRSFLQKFRRKYDEILHPAFDEVRQAFIAGGQYRDEFDEDRVDIEISRFLGWLRVVHARGESWSEGPIRKTSDERKPIIEEYRRAWLDAEDVGAGDMIQIEGEVENIRRIEASFGSEEAIDALDYNELFDVLYGCHAFREMLRFTRGGAEGLRADFKRRNTAQAIKNTVKHLALSDGEPLEMAYDCIFDERYRLGRFGEACVMELLGWVRPGFPPVNGRTIKALRFIGFDVASLASDAD